jgi:hypothetical protein
VSTRRSQASPPANPIINAEEHHHKQVLRDTADQVTGTSAQREANADLMAPLNNRVVEDAVQTH